MDTGSGWVPLVLLVGGCFGSCQGFSQPNTCQATQTRGVVDSLEIGRRPATDVQFLPFADGDTIASTIGGQGSPMVVVRLLVTGTDLPPCLPERTELMRDGDTAILAR